MPGLCSITPRSAQLAIVLCYLPSTIGFRNWKCVLIIKDILHKQRSQLKDLELKQELQNKKAGGTTGKVSKARSEDRERRNEVIDYRKCLVVWKTDKHLANLTKHLEKFWKPRESKYTDENTVLLHFFA